MSTFRFLYLGISLSGFLVVSSCLSASSEWEVSGTAGWDSRYVSEGRDNLEDGGLRFLEGVACSGGYEAGLSWSEGDSVEYEEANLWIAKGLTLGEFDLTGSYTYLSFPTESSHDSELAIELGRSVFEDYTANLCSVYSEDADGLFFELSLERGFEISPRSRVVSYALVSVNSGYVADEPRGMNNAQVGVEIERDLSEGMSAALIVNLSVGIAEGVDDLAWFGLRLNM